MSRKRLRLCCLFWLAGTCSAPAQTLRISPRNSAPGEWVTMEITLQPAAGSAFAALQWELDIPAGALDLDGAPLTRVPLVVKDAGKSINCAVARRSAESLVVPCILAGGQKPIPAGTIVLLSMKIGLGARAGAARIRLQNAVGVSGEAKQAPIEAAEAELTIRSR